MGILKSCFLFALIAGFGCAGDRAGKQREMEMERRNLLNSDRAFAQTSKAQGPAEAFRFYLLEEALQLPDGGGPLRGRDEIVEEITRGGDYSLEWEPVDGNVAASTDVGYTWGYYTFRTGASRAEVVSKGKYLNIWKKDSNGTWKVLIDMGNTGVPGE